MKLSRLLRPLATLLAFGFASVAFAQTAALKADAVALSPAGGVVTLTASVAYDGQPGALAWQLAGPADWSFVSVSGPNEPQIAPPPGATGTLEFAYTRSPAGKAEFSVVVRYPAGAVAAKIVPKVIIRSNGQLTTLDPAAVEWKQQ